MKGGRGGRLQALDGGNRIAPEERGAQRRADGMREKDNSEYCGRRARDLPEREGDRGGVRNEPARVMEATGATCMSASRVQRQRT
jgi:hypothetical protein